MKELKLAARSLVRSPGFTAVAVLTLALGIGANTAMFTVIQAVLLEPLPYPEPERLVRYWATWNQFPRGSISEPEYFDYLEQNQVFDQIAIYRGRDRNLVVTDGSPQRVAVEQVTGQFFQLLGVSALVGRALEATDDAPGAAAAAVASYGFWQSALGGDEGALGSTIDLEGEVHTIVGVMGRDFAYPDSDTDLWVATRLDPADLNFRGAHNYRGIARLRRDVPFDTAQAEMSRIAARLQEQYPENYPDGSGWGVILVPLMEHTVGTSRPALLVLFGAVGLVLLIACANVANLTLVRASGRAREMTLRAVLGAGRARLVGSLVAESALVASVGLLAGLAVARSALGALKALAPESLPRLEGAAIDARVLLFTVIVSGLTVLLFGLLPALRISRTSLVLSDDGRSSAGRAQSRTRSALVGLQVAVAVVLLVGAGLLLRSFRELVDVEPGFEPESVLTLELSLSADRYPDAPARAQHFQRAVETLRALPGVIAAGATTNPPLSGWSNDNYIEIEGYEPPAGYVTEQTRSVAGDYFAAMGIPLLQGERFSGLETEDSRVVIVNEAFARKFWDGQNPIGKRVRTGDEQPWLRVLGVVGNVHHEGLAEPVVPIYYLPHTQNTWRTMTLAVRASGNGETLASSATAALSGLDRTLPVYRVRVYDDIVSDSVAAPRFNVALLLVFGGVAIALAAVGIYGVLAYAVGRRTREIGIRMALGAEARYVPWLVMRQGLLTVGVGLIAGLGAALVLSRVLESLLFGVGARDPVTFVAAAAVSSVAALTACYVPARRAARVNPMVALRYE